MSILRVDLPKDSMIHDLSISTDYYDSYRGGFHSENPVTMKDCYAELFFNYPKWMILLFKIRNTLVRPFKLKTGDISIYNPEGEPELKKGLTLSAFEVLECTNQEFILEIKDSHLDAYISVLLHQIHKRYEVTLTTKVKYNNFLGRIYFFIIRPFHMIVVSALLQKLIRKMTPHNHK